MEQLDVSSSSQEEKTSPDLVESAGAPRRKQQALGVVACPEFPEDWKLEELQYSSSVFLEMRV